MNDAGLEPSRDVFSYGSGSGLGSGAGSGVGAESGGRVRSRVRDNEFLEMTQK